MQNMLKFKCIFVLDGDTVKKTTLMIPEAPLLPFLGYPNV